jgi:hypothetical protein
LLPRAGACGAGRAFAVHNGYMRPQPTVGALTAALVALAIVAALGLTFAALAVEDDEPARPAVVTLTS